MADKTYKLINSLIIHDGPIRCLSLSKNIGDEVAIIIIIIIIIIVVKDNYYNYYYNYNYCYYR